ncbi:MAG: TetR/AcrR family transcriptional regulator, partial [Streptosporangiales bacterium]
RERDQPVAEVPLTAIAAAAGISRSTLVRQVGGTRQALDRAVEDSGVDPGGRPPVRERAIEAAARLISEYGLATVTLDAVARRAECSQPSLYAVFESRDGLLQAVFERYTPLPDLDRVVTERPDDLRETVRRVYGAFAAAARAEPRVMPALVADLFGNPTGPALTVWEQVFVPRVLGSIGDWLTRQVRAGRIRPLPLPLLVQVLIGPFAAHVLTRPALETAWPAGGLPSIEEACEVFAESFLRAVATGGDTGDGKE